MGEMFAGRRFPYPPPVHGEDCSDIVLAITTVNHSLY